MGVTKPSLRAIIMNINELPEFLLPASLIIAYSGTHEESWKIAFACTWAEIIGPANAGSASSQEGRQQFLLWAWPAGTQYTVVQ